MVKKRKRSKAVKVKGGFVSRTGRGVVIKGGFIQTGLGRYFQ